MHGHTHQHAHGAIDPVLFTTAQGIRAVQWSLVALGVTALFQMVVVFLSGSVALLADTIHNFGDAATAIPLWVAFSLARRPPSRRFSYGYGRVEDVAGVIIVLTILLSGVVAGYQSVDRLLHPKPIENPWAVVVASLLGFVGNEFVAIYRIWVGRRINSVALVADGYHARTDGLTSLGVLLGAIGVWLGYPIADPIVGLVITAVIGRIVWDSGKAVFTRLLDGVAPEVIDEIWHAALHVRGVKDVTDVRARWLGHQLHAEVNLAVSSDLSVAEGHAIAVEVRHQLQHDLPYLRSVTIHVDPISHSGEKYHRVQQHMHDGLGLHSHS